MPIFGGYCKRHPLTATWPDGKDMLSQDLMTFLASLMAIRRRTTCHDDLLTPKVDLRSIALHDSLVKLFTTPLIALGEAGCYIDAIEESGLWTRPTFVADP